MATLLGASLACHGDPVGAPAPSIALSSSAEDFTVTAGAADPAAQVISITSEGEGTLSGLSASIDIGDGQPTGWLSATLSGTTAPATLSLAVSTATLAGGTYTASVSVAASEASNSPQAVGVTVEMVPWTLSTETETNLVTGSVEPLSDLQILPCPDGSVATGYTGRQGVHTDELRLLCAELEEDGTLGAVSMTEPLGTSPGGDAFTADCPLDNGVPTMLVRDGGNRNGHIHNNLGYCHVATEVPGGTANAAATLTTPLVGGGPFGDSEEFDVSCPDDSVITGLRGRYEDSTGWVAEVGYLCREIRDR